MTEMSKFSLETYHVLFRGCVQILEVLGVHLHPKAGTQDKGPDSCAKTTEKRVKGKGPKDTTVNKLNDPREEEKEKVGIYELDPLARALLIAAKKAGENRGGHNGGRGRPQMMKEERERDGRKERR